MNMIRLDSANILNIQPHETAPVLAASLLPRPITRCVPPPRLQLIRTAASPCRREVIVSGIFSLAVFNAAQLEAQVGFLFRQHHVQCKHSRVVCRA